MMVTILAFVVLGCRTAWGASVISSSSQIGSNTVYGHIGQKRGQDSVLTDSMTGADPKESTVGKVPNAANGAHALTDA